MIAYVFSHYFCIISIYGLEGEEQQVFGSQPRLSALICVEAIHQGNEWITAGFTDLATFRSLLST